MLGTQNDITAAVKKLHSISFNPIIDGINSSEYVALKVLVKLLENSDNNSVHVSDITKKLKISSPSVTNILNRLEKKGLIVREIDKSNRRNTLVCITEMGLQTKQKNDLILSEFISNVYDRVGRENIIQFLQLAELIQNAFDEEIKIYNTKS